MQTETPSSKKRSSSSQRAPQNRNTSGRGRKSGHWRTSRPDRQEVAAGGIVYRRNRDVIEVFFIKDSFGRWTFPKGHQELGETLAETAIREIGEETGLTGLRYIAPIGKKVLRFRREVGLIQKAVHYFLFEAPSGAKETFRTRAEVGENKELIQEGKWVPMRQAFAVSGYKNSDHLLANAFRLIGGAHAGEKPPRSHAKRPSSGRRNQRRHHRFRRSHDQRGDRRGPNTEKGTRP